VQVKSEVLLRHSTFGHSWSHASLPSLSLQDAWAEIESTTREIRRHTCRAPTLYRPPYGDLSDEVLDLSQRMGQRAVLWNLDTKDYLHILTRPETILE
jgi:peptidoglycan/xylan/chitin deacetylase (PgdA/CDA1 family)